jgi:hypothetical protein
MPGDTDGERGRLALLWFALLGGPAAWTAHLLASYPLVPVACAAGSVMALHAVTAVSVAVATASGLTGWRECRRLRGRVAEDGEDVRVRRAYFMAVSGMFLGGFFAFVTLAEGLPVFFGDPCFRGP